MFKIITAILLICNTAFAVNHKFYVGKNISYTKGICPVAERLNDETYLGFGMCLYDLSDKDIDLVIKSFHKVWNNIDQLK